MKYTLITLLLCLSTVLLAQVRIDGNFAFQTDPAKKYSIYIPSGYEAGVPHRMMLGLHPFNTATWDGMAWCDTLTDFAEANNLILVCPDGGADGRIDDPIDTAFTSVLLDSMAIWYNIDLEKVYAMGFSWGGLTTYTYGLFHSDRFGGYIPIGAAINGTNEVSGIIQYASSKPFYLVHGAQDSPNTRFYPMRSALMANGAIEKDTLMPGVGHTINFPNRNPILSMAYQWIDSVNCAQLETSTSHIEARSRIKVFPNPANDVINFVLPTNGNFDVEIVNTLGVSMIKISNQCKIDISRLSGGNYFLRINQGKDFYIQEFVKQ